MTKKKNFKNDIVWSSEESRVQEILSEEKVTLAPEKQLLHILLEKKGRAGKSVTVIKNFLGTKKELKELGKILKNHCGTGGTVKNNTVEVQGNYKEKISQKLNELNYNIKVIE